MRRALEGPSDINTGARANKWQLIRAQTDAHAPGAHRPCTTARPLRFSFSRRLRTHREVLRNLRSRFRVSGETGEVSRSGGFRRFQVPCLSSNGGFEEVPGARSQIPGSMFRSMFRIFMPVRLQVFVLTREGSKPAHATTQVYRRFDAPWDTTWPRTYMNMRIVPACRSISLLLLLRHFLGLPFCAFFVVELSPRLLRLPFDARVLRLLDVVLLRVLIQVDLIAGL